MEFITTRFASQRKAETFLFELKGTLQPSGDQPTYELTAWIKSQARVAATDGPHVNIPITAGAGSGVATTRNLSMGLSFRKVESFSYDSVSDCGLS